MLARRGAVRRRAGAVRASGEMETDQKHRACRTPHHAPHPTSAQAMGSPFGPRSRRALRTARCLCGAGRGLESRSPRLGSLGDRRSRRKRGQRSRRWHGRGRLRGRDGGRGRGGAMPQQLLLAFGEVGRDTLAPSLELGDAARQRVGRNRRGGGRRRAGRLHLSAGGLQSSLGSQALSGSCPPQVWGRHGALGGAAGQRWEDRRGAVGRPQGGRALRHRRRLPHHRASRGRRRGRREPRRHRARALLGATRRAGHSPRANLKHLVSDLERAPPLGLERRRAGRPARSPPSTASGGPSARAPRPKSSRPARAPARAPCPKSPRTAEKRMKSSRRRAAAVLPPSGDGSRDRGAPSRFHGLGAPPDPGRRRARSASPSLALPQPLGRQHARAGRRPHQRLSSAPRLHAATGTLITRCSVRHGLEAPPEPDGGGLDRHLRLVNSPAPSTVAAGRLTTREPGVDPINGYLARRPTTRRSRADAADWRRRVRARRARETEVRPVNGTVWKRHPNQVTAARSMGILPKTLGKHSCSSIRQRASRALTPSMATSRGASPTTRPSPRMP